MNFAQKLTVFLSIVSISLAKVENIPDEMKGRISKVLLDCHNGHRTQHKVDPLLLDDDLTKGAQEHADLIAKKNSLFHTESEILQKKDIGENLYTLSLFTSTGMDADQIFEANVTRACKVWYCEAKDYDFNEARPQMQALHFTQMIWKSVKQVGFGFSKTADDAGNKMNRNNYYVVARYSPAGNTLSEFASEVQKGNADIANECPIRSRRSIRSFESVV